jgi:hypothetical protein
MTLLLCSFVVVEGKTWRIKRGRAVATERALNQPRNLTSTTLQPQRHLKNNIKNHNKKGEENNDKRRHKNLTQEVSCGVDVEVFD